MQRTLALIKPDAFAAGHAGAITAKIQGSGLRVLALKTLHLTKGQAEGFYDVHKARPFFADLVAFMCQGPIIALALEGDDAIRRWRELMGATDPKKAAPGTVRAEYGASIESNATHGSDAAETAAFEVAYFFSGLELV